MNLARICEYFDRLSVIDENTGCWNWIGTKLKIGYGTCNIEGIKTTAHRAFYFLIYQYIAPGHEIHHKCNNRSCINPDHLESLSHDDHVKVSSKAMQTHCIHGHEFSPQNTYYKVSNGTRVCKTCSANRQREKRKMK